LEKEIGPPLIDVNKSDQNLRSGVLKILNFSATSKDRRPPLEERQKIAWDIVSSYKAGGG